MMDVQTCFQCYKLGREIGLMNKRCLANYQRVTVIWVFLNGRCTCQQVKCNCTNKYNEDSCYFISLSLSEWCTKYAVMLQVENVLNWRYTKHHMKECICRQQMLCLIYINLICERGRVGAECRQFKGNFILANALSWKTLELC